MLQRDFIMRQVHQLAQVLARLMSLDVSQGEVDVEEWLSQALIEVTGVDLERLRRASQSELEELCSPKNTFSPELAVALADVLMEDARRKAGLGRQAEAGHSEATALQLYRLARDAGGVLPVSVLGRL